MARPWQTLDAFETADGRLELRSRGSDDFLITLAGRVLMNSRANRSELALAKLACAALEDVACPNLLIGGLGMGCTLRAALDALPGEARVTVCELHAPLADWCRGALAPINRDALADPRVRVELVDVSELIARRARERTQPALDAILLDLYAGPHARTDARRDPFYGRDALERTRRALSKTGLMAVWSEDPDAAFEKRLGAAGFEVALHRPGKGGRRHAVYVAHCRG
ncbi:MAG: spermidine synthase [Deltaproteobacteria bacterium]|nr:spermidine synthase [Deltaproteobacteria bacterium]MBW2382266.1 spermidine synthase [Deltaproteobacteria bacterium]MBW2695563.1 spermidine synthase [Deltaproteobacteria bacterium]